MDDIHIPNDATYAPVALTDLIAGAPLASRILLGATLPGRVISAAALGMYAGSAVKDWVHRWGVTWIDFEAEFGADVHFLQPMPEDERRAEIERLAGRLSDGWTEERLPREELAREVNRHLTGFIAGITGQRVHTSSQVRDFTMARLFFPFAMGVCDVISGDVAIFKDMGIFEAHIVSHEFVHRKGYWKELHAQVLSYLSLMESGHPVLVQSALAERLHRQLKVLARHAPEDDHDAYHTLVGGLDLRPEVEEELRMLRPPPSTYESLVGFVMRRLYDERLKLTGQNGITDYDEGFTNFLWTFEHSPSARQARATARV